MDEGLQFWKFSNLLRWKSSICFEGHTQSNSFPAFLQNALSALSSFPPLFQCYRLLSGLFPAARLWDRNWDISFLDRVGEGEVCVRDALPQDWIPLTSFIIFFCPPVWFFTTCIHLSWASAMFLKLFEVTQSDGNRRFPLSWRWWLFCWPWGRMIHDETFGRICGDRMIN